MDGHDITPSEEPTAPLPPIAGITGTNTPAAEGPGPTVQVAEHAGLSTPAIIACIAAGALALLLAFVAGWASHGIASRVAMRGFGPGGGRTFGYERSYSGRRGHMGDGERFSFGLRGPGGPWGGAGGPTGRGPMMRGWQRQPLNSDPSTGFPQTPGQRDPGTDRTPY